MLKNISIVCTFFAITTLASTATAGSLIDEDFSSVTLQSAMGMMPLDAGFANTWATASTDGIDWQTDGSVARIIQDPMSVGQTGIMFYYLARPASGDWGGDQLTLSFDHSQTFSPIPANAYYGLYAWSASTHLEIGTPGTVTTLAEGPMVPGAGSVPVSDGYTGDLSGFEFIGVRFAQGMGGSGAEHHTTTVDNVSLTLTPEPMSMSILALGGIALLRRRRRRS